jgi:Tol biopolymer transport system component
MGFACGFRGNRCRFSRRSSGNPVRLSQGMSSSSSSGRAARSSISTMGLNAAMNRLRQALGDSADQPRYIETLPGRGYRFVAPVQYADAKPVLVMDERPEAQAQPAHRTLLPWIGLVAMTLVAVAAFWAPWRARPAAESTLVQFSADFGPEASVETSGTAPVLSPDGAHVVFRSKNESGRTFLSTRLLSQSAATQIAGTEGGYGPFFSSDSQWIGFFADGKLKKAALAGGAAVTLAEASNGRGGAWGPDDSIVFTPDFASGLYRVPAAGGTPQQLTNPPSQGLSTHRWPYFLPSGQSVLFTVNPFVGAGFDDAAIAILSLKTGQWRTILKGGYHGRYLPGGYLVYVHERTLYGVPFDVKREEVRGTPTPLIEHLRTNLRGGNGQYDFSQTGTLMYLSGKSSEETPILWLDRNGKSELAVAAPGLYFSPRLSPDGNRLACIVAHDVYVFDLKRNSSTRITLNRKSRCPVWTPDGKHLVYASASSLWWTRSDGAGEPRELIKSDETMVPYSFSPDGPRLAYAAGSATTGFALYTIRLDTAVPDQPKAEPAELFLRGAYDAAYSPDGRWIAYSSNEASGLDIYVRPFPKPGGKWQVSNRGGGKTPVWSRDGRKLLFSSLAGQIFTVDYTASGDSFSPGSPRPWPGAIQNSGTTPNYDLSPDGTRIVILPIPPSDETKGNVHATFMLNFFDEVRRRIPAVAR